MIFSVLVILFVAIAAYFHWVQGLFSGLLSAACAVIAAVLAFSYHEVLAGMLFSTKMSDQGNAISLVLLFVAVYLVLRVVFDSLVPGNVRFPPTLDKVGGALFGVVAGVFAVGILTIAAQSLPFEPPIAGYVRYTISDTRDVQISVANRGQKEDSTTNNELKSDKINPDEHEGLLFPVDDLVVRTVAHLSDGGSLAGDRPLNAVHENYLDEMFFNRLGIQAGAKHVAANTPKTENVKVQKVFVISGKLPQVEGELAQIRNRKDLKPFIESNPANAIVVVRVDFAPGATDSDHRVRLSPASVRLFANGKNYLPMGTLQDQTVYAHRPDDFLLVNENQSVDFVFYPVPRSEVFKPAPSGQEGGPKNKFVDGAFIEVKRMARASLGDVPIAERIEGSATGVIRKAGLGKKEGD